MVNVATETTANPLAMLMGLFAPTGETKVPDGSDPFSVLMALVPSLVPNTTPLAGEIVSEGTAADDGVIELPQGNVLLSLTPDTANLLGIEAAQLSEQSQASSSPSPSGSQVQIPAEVTVTDDTGGGLVSLKILGEASNIDPLEGALPETEETQDNVIPMHLRTVEQVGQTIVATADLLTAAGKETSVRIQWDLSGRLNGNQDMAETPGQTAGSLPEPQTTGGPGMLSRLLNNVGATLMVIENIEAPSSPAMPALLPGAAAALTKATTQKTDQPATRSSAPSLATSPTAVASPAVAIEGVTSMETSTIGATMSISPSAGDAAVEGPLDLAETSVDNVRTAEATSTMKASTGVGETPIDGPMTFDSAVGTVSTTETNGGTTAVRFLDLDAKLDQLKSGGSQKIRIQLVPANLGKMELTIASHRGLVTVTLTLDSNQAREAVQQSLPVLENRLAASGIRVDNFQIVAAPSTKESFVASAPQSMQHDGFGGYRRESQGRQQEYHAPRRQYEAPGDFTFNAAMVNCLA